MDRSIVISVLENDVDRNGDALSVIDIGRTSSGVEPRTDGTTISYTPRPGWAGEDSFTYTIYDGEATSTARVRVQLACNATTVEMRPTFAGSFAYELGDAGGPEPATTTQLVVSFSEPVDVAKVRGITVVAEGTTHTSVSAVWFQEDWMPGNGETWTFTMSGQLNNGENYSSRTSVQVDTACNSVGDGVAAY